jgi:hypothetical protein
MAPLGPMSEAALRGFSRANSPRGRRAAAARRGWQRRRAEGFRAKARPRVRCRETALALAYPPRQPTRRALIEAYVASGGRRDGAETFALIVRQDWLLIRLNGLMARSTGPQRAAGLARAGRPRVRRTVQRHRRRATELGFIRYLHVRRGGPEIGNRDFLALEPIIDRSHWNRCHPAYGSVCAGPMGQSAHANCQDQCISSSASAADAGRSPPSGRCHPASERQRTTEYSEDMDERAPVDCATVCNPRMPRTALRKWREGRSEWKHIMDDRALWEILCTAMDLNSLEMVELIATEGATVDDLPMPVRRDEAAAFSATSRLRGDNRASCAGSHEHL